NGPAGGHRRGRIHRRERAADGRLQDSARNPAATRHHRADRRRRAAILSPAILRPRGLPCPRPARTRPAVGHEGRTRRGTLLPGFGTEADHDSGFAAPLHAQTRLAEARRPVRKDSITRADSAIPHHSVLSVSRGVKVPKSVCKPSSVVLATALLGAALLPASPAAAGDAKARFLEQSLASQLVQAMTQRRIFEADDKKDAACRDKEFLQATVVQQPTLVQAGSVQSRKWQEDWTLRRCNET